MSNETLMWLSIGIWIAAILILGYFAFFGKTAIQTPSGNQVTPIGGGVS